MTGDEMVEFRGIRTNGISLHVAEAGAADGALVFLLHGFPEFWYAWRNQIEALAGRGFHVVAPDLRGYNLSDKPKGVARYDLDQLAADIVGLADHFGQENFCVVGHDWGASVGWWLAGQQPGRVWRLVALNATHPAVWIESMRDNPVQKRKSRYVRMFQIPRLPEFLIGLDHFKALAKAFPGTFTEADLEQYRKAWSQPGALTAMINYYRAVLKKQFLPAAEYRITCPTLLIWGKRDIYATPELAEASIQLCRDGRVVYLDQATHWVQHDEPERVAELIASFIAPGDARCDDRRR